MAKQLTVSQNEAQLEQALILLEGLKQNNDHERIRKVEKLLKKIYDREFITAFSGHFSAGKSTMINALIGEQILPSSPIPTSANLVKIHRSQEDYAKVHYAEESPLLFQAPYEFETVQSYCKNGEVTEVVIGKTDTLLHDGVTIMDTPGVDSTDDAHRLSTESALHLADLVFYVMDYNHVQSELNFTYTKKLLDHGVKLYLIINQIDKHNDQELSFTEFKQSVYDSFAAWDVHPAGIYFTSLKDADYPGNEFPVVKRLIDSAINHHEEWLRETVQTALSLLKAEHIEWIEAEKQEEINPFLQILQTISNEEQIQILELEAELTEKAEQLKSRTKDWEEQFKKIIVDTLKNAYLMPFETRELAEQYVQSEQKEFKVGFILSKKKTNEEKDRRLSAFIEKLQATIDSQLTWHLRQLANGELKKENIHSVDLQQIAQSITVKIDREMIQGTIKKGAGVTGEAILNYCEDVTKGISERAKKQIEPFIEQVGEYIAKSAKQELNQVNEQLEELLSITHAIRSSDEIEYAYSEKISQFLQADQFNTDELARLEENWSRLANDYRLYTGEDYVFEEERPKEIIEQEKDIIVQDGNKREDMVKQLQLAISALEKEQGFSHFIKQLRTKKERLENNNFTIALFGAFSAGKSSFANSLLGESVLPVSPNPTTAAINRICPPNQQFAHGVAVVHLKTEQNLQMDIRDSLQVFGVHCTSLQEAYEQIPTVLKNDTAEGKDKIHLSFLRAFYEGLPRFQEQLGMSIETNLEDFKGYVAIESQSCFVESIDLYYDCSFTKQGITLVDTPGADSINARHTDVAFEYIKNSDAILFVTYYNHAFSKADREFLIQLGRVKDAFELDKMFFIVNAIDLATSKEEIDLVLQYVTDQLLEYGIRFPRIFGVSSKLAIQVDRREESKIAEFLTAFESFLEDDLTGMVIQAAKRDYNQLTNRMNQLIETAIQNEDLKEEKLKELNNARAEITQILEKDYSTHVQNRLQQEIEELLYYVNERVYLRYPQFFKEAYNPARLIKHQKSLLVEALTHMLTSLGFDFAQEMRASSIRIETYIQKLLDDLTQTLQGNITDVQTNITITNPESTINKQPEFTSPFEQVDVQPFETTFKYFKNPKSFFEKNEKKQMEENLQQLLKPVTDQYIDDQTEQLTQFYSDELDVLVTQNLSTFKMDIKEQFDMFLEALQDDGKVEQWQKLYAVLTNDKIK